MGVNGKVEASIVDPVHVTARMLVTPARPARARALPRDGVTHQGRMGQAPIVPWLVGCSPPGV